MPTPWGLEKEGDNLFVDWRIVCTPDIDRQGVFSSATILNPAPAIAQIPRTRLRIERCESMPAQGEVNHRGHRSDDEHTCTARMSRPSPSVGPAAAWKLLPPNVIRAHTISEKHNLGPDGDRALPEERMTPDQGIIAAIMDDKSGHRRQIESHRDTPHVMRYPPHR